MTGNQTMDYYVRPRHLYSHSRTCTHSIVCRILSRLVDFYICPLIVPVFTRFQLSWLDSSVCQISSAIMQILIHYISSAFMEIMILCISPSWRFWPIYIVRGDDHTYHVLYHAYSWPLYSYVSRTVVCTCSHIQIYLYYIVGWLVLPPGSSSIHFWDGLIMYSAIVSPLWPHTLGGICYSWFYHTW